MHQSVLLQEAVDALSVRPGGRYLDVTAGGGGHSREILARGGTLVSADRDPEVVSRLSKEWSHISQVQVLESRFSELLEKIKNELPFDGVLADLGFSSLQMDEPTRGLSFMKEGPLDMRLDPRLEWSAADYLRDLTTEELADCFYRYGEERGARRLARAIVKQREQQAFETTADLKNLAERVLRPFYSPRQKIHPATRSFQALRILVNREVDELKSLLVALPQLLAPQGRAVVISFHSLEDRMVKQCFVGLKQEGWKVLTKKPVIPSQKEIDQNPRSRSAKMRVIQK